MSLKKLVESTNQKLDEFNLEYMDPRELDQLSHEDIGVPSGEKDMSLTPEMIKRIQGSSGQAVKDYVDQLRQQGYEIPPEILSQINKDDDKFTSFSDMMSGLRKSSPGLNHMFPESTKKGTLGKLVESTNQRIDEMGGYRRWSGGYSRDKYDDQGYTDFRAGDEGGYTRKTPEQKIADYAKKKGLTVADYNAKIWEKMEGFRFEKHLYAAIDGFAEGLTIEEIREALEKNKDKDKRALISIMKNKAKKKEKGHGSSSKNVGPGPEMSGSSININGVDVPEGYAKEYPEKLEAYKDKHPMVLINSIKKWKREQGM
jgi:hypothetical protein